ncbi:MAG TPA: efflux RND transporter periplasmic adaptor subunit [Polyangiaceae bacterium]
MKKPLLLILVTLAAIVAVVIVVIVRSHSARAAREGDKGARDRPVPVTVVRAAKEDVPVIVEGLGTVVPLYTVTVKTQVDGRLDKVFFTEGQYVKVGEPLALVDPRPFEIQEAQAAAQRAKDRATERNDEITLRRDAELERQGLVSQQQVDNDRAAVEAAQAAVMADDAQVRAAALNVTYAHIQSPIDGVTGIRLVDPGNIVHPADATGLVVVTQLDPIAVVFTLPEDDLPRVSEARGRGTPHVTALSRDGTTELGAGDLTVVDNQINQQTATLRIKAQMANPDKKLWPNQFVKARLLLDVKKNALVVPAQAIQRGPKGTFVYVVGDADKAQTRDVQADELQGDRAIVTKGLAAGDRVVTEGQAQIKPGSVVQVQQGK